MQLDRKPFTLFFLELMLLPLSIFLHPKYQKYETMYVAITLLTISGPTVIGELYIFPRLDSFIEKSDVALLTTSTLSIVAIMLAARSRRNVLTKIYKTIAESEFVDESFFVTSDAFLKQMLLYFGPAVIFCLVLLIIFPLLIATYTDTEFGSLPTLLYPAVYPWPMNTPRAYFFTLLFQCLSSTIPFFVIGGIILFTFYSRIVLHCFHLTLISKIEEIDGLNELMLEDTFAKARAVYPVPEMRKMNPSKERDWRTLSQLHSVIQYYQFSHKYVLDIINIFFKCQMTLCSY